MALAVDRVLRGRDRISEVLIRYLEPTRARERANNIAQALVLGPDDPPHIALEMLAGLGLRNRATIAAEVGQAWALGTASSRGRASGSTSTRPKSRSRHATGGQRARLASQ